MTLHQERAAHGSLANNSDDRRIGQCARRIEPARNADEISVPLRPRDTTKLG